MLFYSNELLVINKNGNYVLTNFRSGNMRVEACVDQQ